jgi:hypothetical protein
MMAVTLSQFNATYLVTTYFSIICFNNILPSKSQPPIWSPSKRFSKTICILFSSYILKSNKEIDVTNKIANGKVNTERQWSDRPVGSINVPLEELECINSKA